MEESEFWAEEDKEEDKEELQAAEKFLAEGTVQGRIEDWEAGNFQSVRSFEEFDLAARDEEDGIKEPLDTRVDNLSLMVKTLSSTQQIMDESIRHLSEQFAIMSARLASLLERLEDPISGVSDRPTKEAQPPSVGRRLEPCPLLAERPDCEKGQDLPQASVPMPGETYEQYARREDARLDGVYREFRKKHAERRHCETTDRVLCEKDYRRVEKFGGGEVEWKSWSFDFLTATGAVSTPLKQALVSAGTEKHLATWSAVSETDPVLLAEAEESSSELFNILCQLTKDEAKLLIKDTEGGDGFSAWHTLSTYYNRDTFAKSLRRYHKVLIPKQVPLKDLVSSVASWESNVKEVEKAHGTSIPKMIKLAALTEMCPSFSH